MSNPYTTTFAGTATAYKTTCATFLRTLCNAKDMAQARPYLAPTCTLVHADAAPVHGPDAFLDMWSKNLQHMPDYHKVIIDIICELDDDGAVLWVYSRIRGIPGDTDWTDSVDLMRFDREGRFVYSKDVQRGVGVEGTGLGAGAKTAWGRAYVSF